MAFLSETQLYAFGFASVGDNVFISDKVSIYGADRISIGSNVRIDDYCVLSAGTGGIEIGNYIHIAVYTSLIGAGRIVLSDYCNLSSRVAIYSSNDDYSGEYMTNPMVPSSFTNVSHANTILGKHVIVGCGSVILPGVFIDMGVAIGALSLVSGNCEPFYIYAGSPAKRIKKRKQSLLVKEKELVSLIKE